MGKRNHRRGIKRRKHLTRVYGVTLTGRWASIVQPYHCDRVPSAEELLEILLGVGERRAKAFLSGTGTLPAGHAETLARHLERLYGEVPGLISELRAYAKHRDAALGKRLPAKRLGKTE